MITFHSVFDSEYINLFTLKQSEITDSYYYINAPSKPATSYHTS